MRRVFTVVLFAVLVLAGCGDVEPEQSTSPTATETTQDELSPTPTLTSPDDVNTEEEADGDGQAAADDGLTGFGATREAWDANHEQAPGYSEGAAYLPLLDGDQPKYAAVCCDERIISYLLFLPSDTSLDEAQQHVAGELPDDATPGERVEKDGGCVMQLWESPTLQEATGSNVVVTYFEGDEYDDVTFTSGDSVEDLMC